MTKKAKKLKYYTVILDGIDKCGKDTIRQYIWRMDNRLNVFCRGWPSLNAYAKKFDRNVEYELPWKNTVFVKLTVLPADWTIRCAISNEPYINFGDDTNLFDDAFNVLKDKHYKVLEYNTSYSTPYTIASDIVAQLKLLNGER